MKLIDFFKMPRAAKAVEVGTAVEHPYEGWLGYTPLATPDYRFYDAMREAVPIIDAAIDKIVRLAVGFDVECSDKRRQAELDDFVENIPVGAGSKSLRQFITVYLDSLLTYGNAVGEIVLDGGQKEVRALYNAKLSNIHIKKGKNPLEVVFYTKKGLSEYKAIARPDLVVFTPLNPPAGEITGVSLMRSLPFVTTILMKIFKSTDSNFERMANLRYALTYKPGRSTLDRANAKDIADGMAEQWGNVMQSQKTGIVKDFVAVGDIDVKVIGADSQMLDTQVPVRQMIEQIVAKLGIPPFMLGLHWSTTERMSTQQADILTSELSSYRYHLEGVIEKICEKFLRLAGSGASVKVKWNDINLQDQMEAANVRLINARASELEAKAGGVVNETGND